jgi:hypothetical protein
VHAVFEIKPELDRDYVLYAGGKIAPVRKLVRTSAPFGRANGTHKGTTDARPLGGTLCAHNGWNPAFGEPFETALGIVAEKGAFDLGPSGSLSSTGPGCSASS